MMFSDVLYSPVNKSEMTVSIILKVTNNMYLYLCSPAGHLFKYEYEYYT